MFWCELKFDADRAAAHGYSMRRVYDAVDAIFARIGVPKIADGVYGDAEADNGKLTLMATLRLLDCPEAVHFCTRWRMIDPEEGDQGPCEVHLIARRNKIPL